MTIKKHNRNNSLYSLRLWFLIVVSSVIFVTLERFQISRKTRQCNSNGDNITERLHHQRSTTMHNAQCHVCSSSQNININFKNKISLQKLVVCAVGLWINFIHYYIKEGNHTFLNHVWMHILFLQVSFTLFPYMILGFNNGVFKSAIFEKLFLKNFHFPNLTYESLIGQFSVPNCYTIIDLSMKDFILLYPQKKTLEC